MNQGSFAVIIKKDEVLLVRSSTNAKYINHWSFPGGVVNKGESLKDAAIRESFEETSVVCDPRELISYNDSMHSEIAISIFIADYVSGVIDIDPVEIEEAKWFKLNDSLNLQLAYDNENILRNLIKSSKLVH